MRSILPLMLFFAGLAHCLAAAPDFDSEIAPLLAANCLDCHSGAEPKGKLDLSTSALARKGGETGPAIAATGDLKLSLLWERVAADEMPPKKPLSKAQKQVLNDWLASGAKWGTDPIDPYRVTTAQRAGYDWWSWQPVKRPALPAVKNVAAVKNEVDRFIVAKLEAIPLAVSAAAGRRTLIRRLTFDITGLPPTPEEVAAFVSDQSPKAYEKVVDRLLESPHYGER